MSLTYVLPLMLGLSYVSETHNIMHMGLSYVQWPLSFMWDHLMCSYGNESQKSPHPPYKTDP